MTDSKELVKIAYNAISDKKGENIKIIDISEVTVIADYFIICHGNNMPQVEAITDNVLDSLGRAGYSTKRIEGQHGCGWVLIDYGNVVIHIFTKEDRMFYDLERIWRDGKTVYTDEL